MHEQVHMYISLSIKSFPILHSPQKWYIHVQIHTIQQHMNSTHVYTFPSIVIVHTTENANLSCSTDSVYLKSVPIYVIVHVGISTAAHRYTVHTGMIIIIVNVQSTTM